MINIHYPAATVGHIPASASTQARAAVPIFGVRNLMNTTELELMLLKTNDLKSITKLAEDSKTHPSILRVLSYHKDVHVRQAVADNPNLPQDCLFKLARDQSHDVRYQIAENHNVPVQVISILAEDENPYVRLRAEWTLCRLHAQPQFA